MGFEEKHVHLEGVPPVQDAQGREGKTRREGCCPFGLLFLALVKLSAASIGTVSHVDSSGQN